MDGEEQQGKAHGKRTVLDDLPIPNLEPGSTTPDIPFPAGAENKDGAASAQTLAQGAVFVPKFVEAWRPWKNCGATKGAESKAICSVMHGMGERGDDGMGGKAKYVFTPAQQLLRKQISTDAEMSGQQRLLSHELAAVMEPLNVMQAELNLQRLQLVRALLLPQLEVEGEVGLEGGETPVMMVEEDGKMVRAVLYTDISNGSDGGFNAPYDLNGDGQYVDNWAKVSTDWSYTQPRGGWKEGRKEGR